MLSQSITIAPGHHFCSWMKYTEYESHFFKLYLFIWGLFQWSSAQRSGRRIMHFIWKDAHTRDAVQKWRYWDSSYEWKDQISEGEDKWEEERDWIIAQNAPSKESPGCTAGDASDTGWWESKPCFLACLFCILKLKVISQEKCAWFYEVYLNR